MYDRIIVWFGLEGPYRSSRSNPPATGRDTFHYTRLLKAPFNLGLNSSMEGTFTTSLVNLLLCFTILMIKHFFLTS